MWNFNPKKTLNDLKEWDKKWAKKIQDKFKLTDLGFTLTDILTFLLEFNLNV